MKKNIFTILIVGVAFLFAGCSDDLVKGGSITAGDEISFGGRAGFELNENKKKAATRTVYTGNTWTATNEAGEEKTYEGVNWVANDKVRIFSPQAVGVNPADYTVSATNTEAINGTEQHQVSLNKIGDGALQWSDATEYDFYAVYPSPHQYPLATGGAVDNNYANSVLNNNTSVNGNIPALQQYRKISNDNGNYILHPKMEYAYMVARQKVKLGDKNAKDVYLNFVPIATAVEIELVNNSNETLELTNILVAANDGSQITGEFTANLEKLTDDNNDGSYTGIPESNFVALNGNNSSQISIPTYSLNNGLNGEPTQLANSKSLKFTVFMLPNKNVDDLKITLVGIKGTRQGTTEGIAINKHKKTYLQKMPITAKTKFDQSRWVTYLPNNAFIKGLSIPGAGGAASGYIYDDKADETGKNAYLEQSLEIDELWAQGIRCFEFTVDKVASGSLGGSEVICNNQKTGKTLNDCVTEVTKLLAANPKEFAMVIITYQQSTGWDLRNENTGAVTNKRDPATFMSQLNNYWLGLELPASTDPEITLEKKLYSTGLTVADARGKLFCIARPTSNGEDNYATINLTSHTVNLFFKCNKKLTSTTYGTIETPNFTDPTILVIHGWGALKDKWYARGFTECIYHRGNGWSEFQTIKENDPNAIGYNANRIGRPFDVADKSGYNYTTLNEGKYQDKTSTASLELPDPNFYYAVVTSNKNVNNNAAWVQEWARVAKTTSEYTITINNSTRYSKWIESKTEKEEHIKACLDSAINRNANNNTLYINSLCGYYITSDVPLSGAPNCLTDYNCKWECSSLDGGKDHATPAQLSAMSNEAGMCGDIANFSKDINEYFYDLLLSTTNAETYKPGPMGIILMDRVSATKGTPGADIPSIIIANNFAYELPSSGTLDIPEDDEGFDDDDQWAKPAKRDTKSNSNSVIVWE